MALRFFHGPDCHAIDVTPGCPASGTSGVPFHGIASRGLLPWLARQPDGPRLWQRAAHLLEAPDGVELEPEEVALRAAARRAGVLTFWQSALAAARQICDVADAKLWAIKEGHTSSVWVAEAGVDRFVVNVARDRTGSKELRRSSLRLGALAASRPDLPLAPVLAVSSEDLHELGGPRAVTVTRNTLIEDALEIHRLPGEGGYGLVERFLVGGPDAPARIGGIRGRRVTAGEQRQIDAAIEAVCGASIDEKQVELEVNDGDVVWDGTRAVVVAIS